MKIIPAIDIIDGKCVRLSQGDYNQKTIYSDSPLEVAKDFEANGITALHLVDLDGARSKKIVNYGILESIARQTGLEIDFGGGIKSDEDLKIAFDSGASKITAGSIAVTSPSTVKRWIDLFGADKIILGADCRNQKIAINGWTETSELDLFDFVRSYVAMGAQAMIVTDISKDGQLAGPATELYIDLLKTTEIALIASGGIRSVEDLEHLKSIGCSGAIVGKAIYEGRITLKEIAALC